MCGERAQVSAHNTLRDMLDEGDFVPDSEGVPAENAVLSELEWVDMVVQGWKTMAIEGEDAPPAGSGYAGPPERAPDGVTAAGSGVNAETPSSWPPRSRSRSRSPGNVAACKRQRRNRHPSWPCRTPLVRVNRRSKKVPSWRRGGSSEWRIRKWTTVERGGSVRALPKQGSCSPKGLGLRC